MRIILSIAALLASVALQAQNFSSGTLSNGMSYYLVTNTVSKGFADFALIQKGNKDDVAARASLKNVPLFRDVAPYRYFAHNGIGYDRTGYVRYNPMGTVYSLHDVPIGKAAVSDSTLLALMSFASEWPHDQAIIICGDIDASGVMDALKTISMMVPSRIASESEAAIGWQPSGNIIFEGRWAGDPGNSTIEATFLMKRLPRSAMSTMEPLLEGMFIAQMSDILSMRIRKAFTKADIPLNSLELSYTGSDSPLEQENFRISLSTPESELAQASECLAAVLSSLKEHGVDKTEFTMVKGRQTSSARSLYRKPGLSNSECLERCEKAYLYGTPLSINREDCSFLSRRILDPGKERELLCKYISEVLSEGADLALRYGGTKYLSDSSESLLWHFRNGWEKGKAEESPLKIKIDTSRLAPVPLSKLKILSSAADPVTGGSLWTFSNGMKVIYKSLKGCSEVLCDLVLREGYASLPGATAGESAWTIDLLRLSNVGQMTSEEFNGMLQANDITIDPKISTVSMEIRGSAPREKFSLLMRSLLSLSSSRTVNPAAIKQYKDDFVRMSSQYDFSPLSTGHVLEEMTYPGYSFPSHKRVECLHDDLPQRAEQLFTKAFSNCSNGILVIEGDFEEKTLQEFLCRYLGGFKAGNPLSVRPRIDKGVSPGNPQKKVSAEEVAMGEKKPAVYLRMTAEVPFNLTRQASLKVAGQVIRKAVVRAVSDLGASVEVSTGVEFYPREIMSITVKCTPCPSPGLPEGVSAAPSEKILQEVRNAVRLCCLETPSSADISLYRGVFISEREALASDPLWLIDAAAVRYCYGKDIVSSWKDSALKVSGDGVRELLVSLYSGSRVEYCVK